MAEFGLLGERLSHSWSPALHKALGGYDYDLFSVAPEALGQFLEATPCRGLNVTIPYKKAVLPHCAALSPVAKRLGSVNTLLRRGDGWYGDNTDYTGFCKLMQGFRVRGADALVLGSGGAGVMAAQALRDLGARQVEVVSRTGRVHYGNLNRSADLIVNATPVGMYPENGHAPIDLREFPNCGGVVDLIYNPLRTKLLLEAETLGIAHENGLPMLVAQAQAAAALFLGRDVPDSSEICKDFQKKTENIVLIGMPGCGKSTVGALLAQALHRPFFDADVILAARYGAIAEIFAAQGEAAFRAMETQVLAELGKMTGIVLATGGGAVVKEENYPLLRQNGTLFWLCRPLSALPIEGRPLSRQATPAALYAQREERYRAWASHRIQNTGTPDQTVAAIMEVIA